MASVNVRGTAAASVTPDRAELSLEVRRRAKTAAEALTDVATRSQQLVSMLEQHGIGRTDWVTEGVHVGEDHEWRKDQHVLVGHVASTAVTVTLRDISLVGAVIRDGVDAAGASVRSLTWAIDRSNPAQHALLAEAALDARRRATAYTEALGLRLGEVELISEEPPNRGGDLIIRRDAMVAMSDAPGAPEVQVSAGLIELTAEVHVRFSVL
jgi:uncharacterized protein YggE